MLCYFVLAECLFYLINVVSIFYVWKRWGFLICVLHLPILLLLRYIYKSIRDFLIFKCLDYYSKKLQRALDNYRTVLSSRLDKYPEY